MWAQYPKHLLESQREIPYTIVEQEQPKEIREKRVKPHILTQYARKKFPLPQYNGS
jgi:hypothetical protein